MGVFVVAYTSNGNINFSQEDSLLDELFLLLEQEISLDQADSHVVLIDQYLGEAGSKYSEEIEISIKGQKISISTFIDSKIRKMINDAKAEAGNNITTLQKSFCVVSQMITKLNVIKSDENKQRVAAVGIRFA